VKWKDFWDNPEELLTGFCLQLPLWAITKLWTIPAMISCMFLYRWGGCKGGWKPARWALVPLMVCGASIACGVSWWILLAVPFMLKLAPSYGEESWLYNWVVSLVHLKKKADFLTRLICFGWYWGAFSLAYLL